MRIRWGPEGESNKSSKIRKSRNLGFDISTIPVYVGNSNNYTLQHLVQKVVKGSLAETAGLKEMDLITHINSEPVQVRKKIRKKNPIKIY